MIPGQCLRHFFKDLIVTIAALLLGSLGVLLTGCTFSDPGIPGRQSHIETPPTTSVADGNMTPSFLVSLPPLPPLDLNELNQRAMETVKKSPIRSNSVIGIHHINLSEHKLFDEFFPLVSSDPAAAPPVVFALSALNSVMVVTDRLRTTDGGLSWVGHIQNNPRSSVLFLADTKTRTISGEIRIDGKIYEIRPGERRSYAVFAIEPSRLPPEHSSEWYETPSESHVPRNLFPTTATRGDSPPVIDVMVLYTQEAIDADHDPSSNLATQICYAITQINESFFDSGVTPLVRLVHHGKIDFPESGQTEQDAMNLADYTFEQSKSAHRNRKKYGADLVSLWVGDGDANDCGAAQVIIQPGGSGALAFSVVRRNCAITDLGFAHELGHLMGAHHDRFDAKADTSTDRNYGYIRPDKDWMTIMAVDVNRTDCPLKPNNVHSCERVKYWSNPAKSYPPPPSAGDAMGSLDTITPIGCRTSDPVTTPCDGPADNTTTLNNNASAVSRFMPTARPTAILDLGHVSCDVINTGEVPRSPVVR